MSKKDASRAHTMSEEIQDAAERKGGERPPISETPVTGASRAPSPPRPPADAPVPPGGTRKRKRRPA